MLEVIHYTISPTNNHYTMIDIKKGVWYGWYQSPGDAIARGREHNLSDSRGTPYTHSDQYLAMLHETNAASKPTLKIIMTFDDIKDAKTKHPEWFI